MKSLAELIVELQKIPNPEKVGVALFDGDFYIPIEKNSDFSQTSVVSVLLDDAPAKAQGFESLVTF